MGAIKQLDIDEIKKWLKISQRYWYLIVAIMSGAILFAFIYNYVTPPSYAVSARLLIKENDPTSAAQLVMGQQLMATKVNNELAVLRSHELIKKVVATCPFEVSYFEKNRFRIREVYPSVEYEVQLNKQHAQLVGVPIRINSQSDSLLHIFIEGSNVSVYDFTTESIIATVSPQYDTIVKSNVPFKTDFCEFTIKIKDSKINAETNCYFVINTIEANILEFENLGASTESTSGIVTITNQTCCPQKGVIFINQLLAKYFEHTVLRQNIIANNTLILVDTLLRGIRDSLFTSEDQLKNFKKSRRLLDIDYQSQKSFGELTIGEKERAELALKRTYLQRSMQSLQNASSSDALALPATFDVSDGFLDKMVEEYNTAVLLKKEIKQNTLKDPPYLIALEVRINNARNAVIDAMRKLDENLSFSITEASKKINTLYSNIDSIPETSRDLVRIERRYHLHEGVYTFLLQKQSEMQILKAGNIPVNETLEYARLDNYVFLGPFTTKNIIKAIFIGLALCFGLLYVLRLLHNQILSVKEIESLSESLQVFASIYHNREIGSVVMQAGSHSPVSESFRTLQANFQFFPKIQDQGRVCLVTSSDMGEGKSFVSVNMAYSLASNKKKVALLGLDLRRPTLHSYLGVENSNAGLSSCLSGAYTLNQIKKSTDNPCLDFYNAGPIPPNPTELLDSDAMREIVKELKLQYDYVIIDTPPIGRVGDFLYLSPLADTIFYIVRHNVSVKPFVKQQIDLLQQKGVKNLSIIFNDCPIKKRRSGYYGYGYY